jgi:hypothetical protein
MPAGAPRHARIGALGVTATVLVAVAVVAWNSQAHEARVAIGWVVTAIVVAAATWLDLRSRAAPAIHLSLVVATGWLYAVAFGTVMVILFGWLFAVFGVVVGVPATALAWLARRRIQAGRADGAVLALAMLVTAGGLALTRPWSPSSAEWAWGAGVTFAAATVIVADLVRTLLVHRARVT